MSQTRDLRFGRHDTLPHGHSTRFIAWRLKEESMKCCLIKYKHYNQPI